MAISEVTSIAEALTAWGYEFNDDGKKCGAAAYYQRENVRVFLWSLADGEAPYSVTIYVDDLAEGFTKRRLELNLEVWPLFAAIEIIRAVYAERNS
jgi:hypothetical protein